MNTIQARTAWLGLLLLTLSACTTTGVVVPQPKTIPESLLAATVTLDATAQLVTKSVTDGTLSPDKATAIIGVVEVAKNWVIVASSAFEQGRPDEAAGYLGTIQAILKQLEESLKGAPP